MNGDDHIQTLENDWPISIWVAQFHGNKYVITDDEWAKELERNGFEVERYTILKPRKGDWP